MYLLPDETHFKCRGLTCLQEATMLTAGYLQNTTPGSLQAAEISALPSPHHRELHHHRCQGFEKEGSYNACPGPCFPPPLLVPGSHVGTDGDAVRSRKAPVHPPRDPRFDVQGSQFPQGCSIAPSAQGDGAGLSLPTFQLPLAQAEMGLKLRLKESSYWEKSSFVAGLGDRSLGAMHTKLLGQ